MSFDFWNTLYLDGREDKRFMLRQEYLAQIINSYRPITSEEFKNALSKSADFFFSEWQNNSRTPTVWERIRFISNYLSVEIREEHVNEIADYFCSLIFSVPPEEIREIKVVIPDLAQKFPLGLISDTGYITGKYIRQFLQRENLLQYFSSFMFSDEQANSKPHRSVFEKTAENLHISLDRLIHIGDLERTDIAGARQAGCYCVKFTGANNSVSPDKTQAHFVINNYQELPATLTKLIEEIRKLENI